MNCPSCKQPMQPGDNFCNRCGARLPQVMPAVPSAPSKTGLTVVSFVLAVLSAILGLAGWLLSQTLLALLGLPAGLAAVVLGAIAVARPSPKRPLTVAGIAAGSAGLLLSALGLFLTLSSASRLSDESKLRASVKNNMHVFQMALEAYAVDHFGNYPSENVSWDPDDENGICLYFPGGDPIGMEGEPKPGNFPVNPYTNRRYEYGHDLFYFPRRLQEPGQAARKLSIDPDCPYNGFAAPNGIPGTVVIIGYSSSEKYPPENYGIIGFDRNTSEPMSDADEEEVRVYFVLHN